MKKSIKTYLSLAGIFWLSVTVSYIIPIDDKLKEVIAIPAVLALFGALLHLWKKEAWFEEQKHLRNNVDIIDPSPNTDKRDVS